MKKQHSVLLVDDERENLNLLDNILGESYFTYKTRDPEAALGLLREHDIQLMITDQRMPRMNGITLLERARAQKPHVVRVLVTAYPDIAVAIDAINRGQVKRYLLKPFDPDELQLMVRQELEVFELEQANRRLAEELGRAVDQLLKTNRELQELDRMKDHFLTNVSHELKTPLVSSIGYLDLILSGGMGGLAPKVEKGMRVSHRNLERLLGLIEDLLALARMRYRPESLRLATFDLRKLVDECAESLRGRSRKASLDVKVSVPASLPPVRADERKIHSVFTNVLSNAEKFTPDRAKIAIQVRRAGDRAIILVTDNGIGIGAQKPGSAFPYFKHDEDRRTQKYGGLGVGLMLVRQILQAHGCPITLARRPRGGTEVTFELPLEVAPVLKKH